MSAAPYDCRECAACCRDASDGRVGVAAEDLVRWKREGRHEILAGIVPGHFGEQAFAARPDGSCIHLGVPGRPNDCSVYSTRGAICHLLQPGDPQCKAYRRVAGLPT
ncbi:MAG: YkgJ family cysteine cluster protein [Polyangiaceae bacterium]|nr:YkgJ family cysteine cluster protein [Polyangiaceae bacterium]MBK8994149.1 YkgJ family cysteine cluster protein [Myxococcales bacterium]MCE7892920.1 hypothetical protein [Sorangiineae bacterium PRO1]MCL4753776.1 YkgJ family cysteine cluster protein [Myxococcales bacterium]